MLKLEDLEVYQIAMQIGDKIWNIVDAWEYFPKSALGNQLTRAADSIAANISEGYGRFSFKENKQFCFYSRGSLMETKTFLTKAKNRNLISETQFEELIKELETNHFKLNAYIKSIGKS
jgi:four helix bundle protein